MPERIAYSRFVVRSVLGDRLRPSDFAQPIATGRAQTLDSVAEAERMKQLVRDCDNELAEMELIESYQRDERREVSIRIEPEG